MKATVEISMYPLNENYIEPILDFIQRLKSHPGFELRTNETSTQLFGEYNAIFDALKMEIAQSFGREGKEVFILKIIGTDLSK